MVKTQRDIPKAKLSIDGLKKIFQLLSYTSKKDKFLFLIGTLFLLFTAITVILLPNLLQKAIGISVSDFNHLQKNAHSISAKQIEEVAWGFVVLFFAQALFSFLRISMYVRVAENLIFAIRKALFKNIVLQEMDFFIQNRSGEILSRFSSDLAQIQDTFTTNLAMFIRQLLIVFLGAVMVIITSPNLAIWMIATVPVTVLVSLFFGKYIRKVSKQITDKTAENNVIVEENLTGIVNVKSFANEDYEIERYKKNSEQLRKESIYRGLLRGAFSSFIILCLFGSIVFLIFIGLEKVRNQELKIEELISFMMYTGFVGGSIGGIAEQLVQLQKSIGSVERVLELIKKPTENINLNKDHSLTLNIEILKLSHVRFSYPARPELEILKGINLSLKKGESVALVGTSGAGKSTLAQLLLRFYKTSSGEIQFNNTNVEDLDLWQFRKMIAFVPQEIILFGGTIYENICYGKTNALEQEVIEAAKKAYAYDFIQSFPEKFNTLVGDRGIKLSGGQKQRIAIARAMLKDPQLLILDEATSALDSESEVEVQKALDNLMKNRTSLVIAHRLSTIRNCNKIVVLENGVIAEEGSHEELMKKETSLYKNMVELQNEEKK